MAFTLFLFDVLILLVSAALASALWLADGQYARRADSFYISALAFALVIVLSMSTLGLYQHDSREDFQHTLLRLLPSLAIACVLLSVLNHLVPAIHFGRGMSSIIIVLGVGGVGVLLTRLVLFKFASSVMPVARLILVGAGAMAKECINLASSKPGSHQFVVAGCIDVAGEECCVPDSSLLPFGPSLLAIAHKYDVDEIVISVSERRNGAFPAQQLLECAVGGVRVIDAAALFEREACQIRIDSLQPSYLIFGGGFDQGILRSASKRIFDLAASAAIFIVTLPVMLVTAALIRLDDGGPVFYRQERVGKNGRIFKVLKFRSMRIDAEQDGKPKWAAADDARVTKVGHVIRKLRIDELPQLLNVFRGEMSIVGPRPERPSFVVQLSAEVPYYNVRHDIKPGITGLAQVRYGSAEQFSLRR